MSWAVAAPALIQAGGSLLGAAVSGRGSGKGQGSTIDKRQRRILRKQRADFVTDRRHLEVYSDPRNQRKRLEAAGINPLGLVTSGSTSGATQQATTVASGGGGGGSQNTWGSAISNAFTSIGQAVHDVHSAKLRETELEQKYERLKELVDKTTFREPVGGIYANPYLSPDRGFRSDGPLDPAGNPVTNTGIAGGLFKADPDYSDAELMEQRYGDVGSSVYGIGVAIADQAYNKSNLIGPQPMNDDQRRFYAGRAADIRDRRRYISRYNQVDYEQAAYPLKSRSHHISAKRLKDAVWGWGDR